MQPLWGGLIQKRLIEGLENKEPPPPQTPCIPGRQTFEGSWTAKERAHLISLKCLKSLWISKLQASCISTRLQYQRGPCHFFDTPSLPPLACLRALALRASLAEAGQDLLLQLQEARDKRGVGFLQLRQYHLGAEYPSPGKVKLFVS